MRPFYCMVPLLMHLFFHSSICLGADVSLSNKDIIEIVERKKPIGQKVLYTYMCAHVDAVWNLICCLICR